SETSQIQPIRHLFNPPDNEEKLYSLFEEHVVLYTEICISCIKTKTSDN
ncbi:35544_t:CDS:2, partial [Racocetra persica]